MVNAFVSRQDQLRQQQQQEDLLRRQAEQQALDNQLRQQQLAMQQEAAARDAENDAFNRARLTAQDERAARDDGTRGREGEFRTVLAPMMNDFQAGLDADLARYAPTLKDGRANPGYDRAMYEATVARQKQARKLWSQVGMTVGQGQGWDEARAALVSFLGGDAPAPGAAPQAPAAPPVMDMHFGPPAPSAAPTPAPTAPAPTAPAQPQMQGPQLPQSLPAAVQDIPPSQLASLDDAALLQRYGQGGLDYARAARAEYTAQQAAQQEKVRTAQVGFWAKAAQNVLEDKDHPATPEQLSAASTVMALINLPSLTDEQVTQFSEAVKALTPRTLTAATWQSVLDTKDPVTVLGALPMYQAQAPDVVRGFDPEPYRASAQAALDKDTAAAAASMAGARKDDAATTRTEALLPGEVQAQTDTHDESVAGQGETAARTGLLTAQTAGEVADTASTRATTDTTRFKLGLDGIELLASFPPDLSYTQLAQAQPQLVGRIKASLGLNDAGMLNLWRQAQYKYGLGLRGDELKNDLIASQVAGENADRGLTLAQTENVRTDTANDAARAPLERDQLAAETANTRSTTVARNAELQPRLNLLNAQIASEQAQGRNVDSLIRERDTLLPLRAAQTTAQTANVWANIANTRSVMTARDRKLQPELDLLNAQINAAEAQGLNTDSLRRRRDALLPYELSGAAQDLKIDREKAAAYIQGVKGNYAVDMAQVLKITADTALTRAKDPNDPLYNPVIANAKPGDPVTALQKRAGVFYTQADQALKQAQTLQGQINGLTNQAKGVTGTVDLSRLSPTDRTKLDGLTAQRDKLFAAAQNARQKGDDVVTQGMQNLPQPGVPTKTPTVATGLPAAQQWAAQNREVPGVDSDCAAIAGKYLNALGFSIPTSNLSAGLEANAKKAGWTANPGGYEVGDLVVWTGTQYGLQKNGAGVGKHVGAIAGFDANGNPMILDNPGKLNDGTQGQTRVRPMNDAGNAVVYRAPAGKPPTQAAKPTASAPRPTTPAAPSGLPRPDPKISGVGPPQGLTPVGLARNVAQRITRAAWVQAQGIEDAGQAQAWLERTVNGLMPKGTPAQKAQMKTDLATTLGW